LGTSRWIVAAAVSTGLTAAASLWAADMHQAARITNPTPASRSELARVVSEALGGVPITLAEDALTQSSLLVIEHARPRDAQGRLLQGREMRRPEQFRLVKSGSDCVLVHVRTGRQWVLKSTACTGA
jgi:hypothetical protein